MIPSSKTAKITAKSPLNDEIEPDKDLVIKIATIDELKKSSFKGWFEVGNK